MGKTAGAARMWRSHGLTRGGWRATLAAAGVTLLLAGCGQHASAVPSAKAVTAPAAARMAGAQAAAPGRARPASPDVSNLLVAARDAYARHRLVAPAGSNAMEDYVAVLARDPGNQVATDALRDMFPFSVPLVRDAIARNDFNEARREIDVMAKAQPGNYTVDLLRAELDAQQARVPRAEARARTAARKVSAASSAEAAKPVPVLRGAPGRIGRA